MGANIVQNRVILMLAVPLAIFAVMATVIEKNLLVDIMNWCLIFTAFTVTAAYGRLTIESIRDGRADRVAHLAIGISLSWLAVVMSRGWIAGYRLLEYEWMKEATFVSFYLFTYVMAGVYHITAPELVNGRVAPSSFWAIGLSLACGGFVAGVLAGIAWAS